MLSNLFLIYKRDLQMCTFHIFARYKYRFLDEKIIIYYSRKTTIKMTYTLYFELENDIFLLCLFTFHV